MKLRYFKKKRKDRDRRFFVCLGSKQIKKMIVGVLFWMLQIMISILLVCSGFLHGVCHAISLVDQKGLVNKYRYRRSEGLQVGTAAIGVGICTMSTAFTVMLCIYHYMLFNMDWGFMNPALPMMIAVFYSMVLPPVCITAYIGVLLLWGVFELVQKRANSGKPAPGQLEPPPKQPLDIDMEIYVWQKLRDAVLKHHLHYISEVGGIVGGLPTGIMMGGLWMLIVGTGSAFVVDQKVFNNLQDFTNTLF